MRTAEWNTSTSVLDRAARVLGAFQVEDRELGVSELARRTGLAKSTVARLTDELARLGFLERQSAAFRPGLALFELGQLAATPKELRKRALEVMSDLRIATGQTIHLAVLDRAEVVYIAILRGLQTPTLPSRVGGRLPAHATAVGKAMLAFAGPDALEDQLARGLTMVGPQTITEEETLRGELEQITRARVSYEREESAPGSCCVASPVFDSGGSLSAAISASGTSSHLDVERVAPAVHTAALALGRLLPHHAELPRT